MNNSEKIRTAARRLRYVLLILVVLIPLTELAGWLLFNHMSGGNLVNAGNPDASAVIEIFPFHQGDELVSLLDGGPLPLSTRALGFMVSMIPTGVLIYGLLVLINLFKLYEAGRIFTPDNVRCCRRLAGALLWWVAAGLIYRPLMSLVLTMHFPPGERQITIGLGSPDLTALLVGTVLWVVAWVMAEGNALREEQELTV